MAKKSFAADGGGSKIYDCPEIDRGGIRKINLLFKTHLDLGFTDFASEIERKYYKLYIPKALQLAKQMRLSGGRRFVWTLGSYLVYGFLEQADPEETEQMEEAIRQGDISWHALPLTTHTELMDESLLEYGISLSRRLDERFGKHTVAGKLTDVPGHTIGMLPVLAKNGVRFLHIGVNPASGVPEVPDTFRWQDAAGNEVVVMYSKDDYGNTAVVPGCDTAVSFAHTGDNRGPQDAQQVEQVYEILEQRYPGVEIEACGLNDFALEVLKVRDSLPVVTQEIGDTWIHGAGTDPKKVSGYRALLRLRSRWIEEGRLQPGTQEYERFSRKLLCIPEHTWGMARFILDDYENYTKSQLEALRKTAVCKRVEASWQEQRDYVTQAVQALQTPDLRQEALQALEALSPVQSDLRGMVRLQPGEKIETETMRIGFDHRTGAINYLKKHGENHQLATAHHPIGEFMYEVFSNEDFRHFTEGYLKNISTTRDWSIPTFTKPGVPGNILHRENMADRAEIFWQKTPEEIRIFVKLSMNETDTEAFGCPRRVTLQYRIPAGTTNLQLRLTWSHKDASRFTEAIWLRINPQVQNPKLWQMDKLAAKLSPLCVVRGGNRHLHAVKTGLFYDGPEGNRRIRTLDAPLVGVGAPAVVYFNRRQPSTERGFYFNLYNNQWNTNFPYWYEDDAVFRFELDL